VPAGCTTPVQKKDDMQMEQQESTAEAQADEGRNQDDDKTPDDKAAENTTHGRLKNILARHLARLKANMKQSRTAKASAETIYLDYCRQVGAVAVDYYLMGVMHHRVHRMIWTCAWLEHEIGSLACRSRGCETGCQSCVLCGKGG